MKNIVVKTHARAWFAAFLFSFLSVPLAAQQTSPRAPLVSDWTRHHTLFRESADIPRNQSFSSDPRRVRSWYAHHPEAMWPQLHARLHPERAPLQSTGGRDWSIPLGNANFAPTYDGTFSFSLCCGVPLSPATGGSGTLTAVDLGNGSMLATQGSITLKAGAGSAYFGTYTLYPGGPSPVWTSDGFDYDNLIYPNASSQLDCNGLLFGNHVLYDVNLRRYSNYPPSCPNNINYEYKDYNSASSPNDNWGTNFTLTMSSAPNPGANQTYPAKYVFDVATVPSCANDFVVMGVPALPTAGGQANIVGYNNLYTNSTGIGGSCPGTGPTILFAYASGTGMVPASVSLSMNGQQIAYVENLAGSSYLHVLTIGTTGTNGSSATNSVVPGIAGGNNAIDQRVLLSPDGVTTQSSTSAVYVDYGSCAAYVTTYSASSNSGYLFKISNIFSTTGAPTVVWSVPIDAIPSAPVYDSNSQKIFFTDSAGRIDYVIAASGSPQLVYGPVVAMGATSENPVIIDDAGQMIYASFNSNGTNAVVVQTPTTLASWVSTPVGAATTYTGPYSPDFNNAWYTGVGTPLMYVAGTGTGTLPTLYSIGFNASGVMNSSANGQTAALTTGNADASPVTEFYNAALAKDFLFVGVTNNCIATALGGSAGCVMSLDITNGFPTVSTAATSFAAAGGTTGIVVDNESSLTEASSIYYATKTGATLVKVTQNGLN